VGGVVGGVVVCWLVAAAQGKEVPACSVALCRCVCWGEGWWPPPGGWGGGWRNPALVITVVFGTPPRCYLSCRWQFTTTILRGSRTHGHPITSQDYVVAWYCQPRLHHSLADLSLPIQAGLADALLPLHVSLISTPPVCQLSRHIHIDVRKDPSTAWPAAPCPPTAVDVFCQPPAGARLQSRPPMILHCLVRFNAGRHST